MPPLTLAPAAGRWAAPDPVTLAERFAQAMRHLLPDGPPAALGIAVSGGGDSTALLYLAADWAKESGTALWVVTIDHGLRPAAKIEAAQVAVQCADLGLPHATLAWAGWDGQGNLQDAARRARHGLIDHWRGGVGHILLGHTAEDQAETVMLRLARGSGVDGLSGIAPTSHIRTPPAIRPVAVNGDGPPISVGRQPGFTLLRPLLGEHRAVLRDELKRRGVMWAEDPSNDDDRFDRVRARRMLASAAPLGIDVSGLTETAARMARARRALELVVQAAALELCTEDQGDVVIDRAGLATLDDETRLRLMAHSLCWVASTDYRPRLNALERLVGQVLDGTPGTLHGCRIGVGAERIRVHREWKAVAETSTPVGAVWDHRWRLAGDDLEGLEVRALGEIGLNQIDPEARKRRPRASLEAAPGIWDGDTLVAAPLIDWGAPAAAVLNPPRGPFTQSIISH